MKSIIRWIAVAVVVAMSVSGAMGQAAKNAKAPDVLDLPEVSKDEVICFALYTVSNNILKLTAQLYPLEEGDDMNVRLEIKKDGEWAEIAKTQIVNPGWTAPFRVEKWDHSKDWQYRVRHGARAEFSGTIKKDPVDKDIITVFGFTGNSILAGHGGDIARTDIVENIKRLQPDLLFFSGDQVYNHTRHYDAWMKFGRDFGDVIRNYPTITIPDDHDVGQANLWGAGGKKSMTGAGHDGGYFSPIEYVKEVERAQTSHLPDPFDPTPIERGIGVYYTSMNIGKVGFAIIEDRKFKSGPEGLVPQQGPRPDHIRNPDYDPKSVDVPGAVLLGDRQIKFLDTWTADWTGQNMKCVLSQTVFAGGAHIHGSINGRLHGDMDSNGWPQTGRNRALASIRKGYALMYCGDQHLATIFHHGIDNWGDAGYSFCVPSIANLYLRWWKPLKEGLNREPGQPWYTGDFKDGFDNKVTLYAVANPEDHPNGNQKLTTRAAGYGIVKFDTVKRTITMECWPRNVDITDPKNTPYPGWPKTIHYTENYGREAVAYLPILQIKGESNPVVQIVDEADGSIVYTLRIEGNTFRPKVFANGTYTVKVGEGAAQKTLKGVHSIGLSSTKVLEVEM